VRVVLPLVLLLASSAALGQTVTAAKPTTFTLNSGAAGYPTALWLLKEGSGTTLEDEIGSLDLTITGADWGSGALGTTLTMIAANADRIQRTGFAFSASFGVCGIWLKASDPAAAQVLFSAGDSAADSNLGTRVGTNGQLVRRASVSGTVTSGTASYDMVTAGGYVVICLSGDAVNVGVSMQGQNILTTGHAGGAGLITALDKLTAGCESDNSAAENCVDGTLLAMWYYGAAIDNTLMAAIGVANPWPVIGVVATGGGAVKRRRH
jgi:hypothetical protein